MSAHTPGPWVWIDNDGCEELFGSDGEGVITSADGYWSAAPKSDADKALIAAAPELLAALDGLLNYEPAHCACGFDGCTEPKKAWDAARDAIAKAEGRA